MSIFKDEKETKRVIFNVDMALAERLEKAKGAARAVGRKLDVDGAIDKALEKYLKKAEKKLLEMDGPDVARATEGQEEPVQGGEPAKDGGAAGAAAAAKKDGKGAKDSTAKGPLQMTEKKIPGVTAKDAPAGKNAGSRAQ